MELTPKQTSALDFFEDKITSEILFGGGAGGGKSILGCYAILKAAIKYPKTRWVIGRAVLKTLKDTTLNSFYTVTAEQGIRAGEHFKYNAQSNTIYIFNGSEILLKDLFSYPSDPNFDELGSLEITGAFVDECNQVTEKAWEILKSRIRYRLDEYGLIPKILGSCNPSKNWVFRRFYLPFEQGVLPQDKVFVQSLATDNKNISKHYIENLMSLSDNASKERLLYGNWNYDDNPNSLCDRDSILSIFEGNVAEASKTYYISADVARFGSDKAVVLVWRGMAIIEFKSFDISKITDIQAYINAMRAMYRVSLDHIVVDGDGVGGGLVDNLGCVDFVNNSSPMINPATKEVENYVNLQSQCAYKLAEKINNREIVFECDVPGTLKDQIAIELEQLQTWKSDQDGKLRIKPKAEIKTDIGKSPDWRDALLMKMYFEYVISTTSNTSALKAFA